MSLVFALMLAQTIVAPSQIPWRQVDLGNCAPFPTAPGTRVKLGQLRSPQPATDCWPVDLSRQAFSVINSNCTRCHGNDLVPGKVGGVGNLDLRSRAAMIRGGNRGPAMRPGNTRLDGSGSLILWFVTPRTGPERSVSPVDEPLSMPPYPFELTPADIEAIRAWISAGAPEVP